MPTLAENLRILRHAKGLSQGGLAEAVGVSRATINRIEQGHRMPDFDLACRIADALGVSTDALRDNLTSRRRARAVSA
jgi:putative transcriptional regulator